MCNKIMSCLDILDVCIHIVQINHLSSHIHGVSSTSSSTAGLTSACTLITPKFVFSILLSNFMFSSVPSSPVCPHVPWNGIRRVNISISPSKDSTLPCLPISANTIPIILVPKTCKKKWFKLCHPLYLPMPISDQLLLIFSFTLSLSFVPSCVFPYILSSL